MKVKEKDIKDFLEARGAKVLKIQYMFHLGDKWKFEKIYFIDIEKEDGQKKQIIMREPDSKKQMKKILHIF